MTSVADRLAQKTSRRTASKQVRLRLVHIDFWSCVKLAALLAVCLAVIGVVMTFVVWTVLEQTGVLDSVNKLLNDVTGSENSTGVQVSSFVNLGGLMLFSLGVGLLNLVVLPALAAVAAFIYNLTVKVTGGLVLGFTNG
ncbi:putative protein [Pseudoclavibacter triregionum]|nr:putative protein [Pseudoclavibacter triregionum]